MFSRLFRSAVFSFPAPSEGLARKSLEGHNNNALASSSSSSFFSRFVHNPASVRGVGPRPRTSNRPTLVQKTKRIAALADRLQGLQPISGPVSYQANTIEHVVRNFESGAIVGRASLSAELFAAPLRRDIIQRVVRWQMAKTRQGTHKMKTRAEVSGTGKKPFPQKGQGRARRGTLRAPHNRGGGVAHGPKPRSHAHSLPKRVRTLGLRIALTSKLQEKNFVLVSDASLSSHKTKALGQAMEKLGVDNFLLIHGEFEATGNLQLAVRARQNCDLLTVSGSNVLAILRHPTLIMTQKALQELEARIERFNEKRGPKFLVGSRGGGLSFKQFKQKQQGQ